MSFKVKSHISPLTSNFDEVDLPGRRDLYVIMVEGQQRALSLAVVPVQLAHQAELGRLRQQPVQALELAVAYEMGHSGYGLGRRF